MNHTLVFHLFVASRKLQNAIGFKSLPLALSNSEANTLLVIDFHKEITQKEIATKLHLKPASVVTLIDELEKLMLVSRQTPKGDRRKYLIILTAKGKEEVETIKKRIDDLENFLKEKIANSEAKSFFSTLEKISENLDLWQDQNLNLPKSMPKGGEK